MAQYIHILAAGSIAIQAETRSEERNLSLQQIFTHLQLSQQSPHTFSMLPKVFFGVRAT